MLDDRSYRTQGSTALACRYEPDERASANLIDYDVARRSYEARKRLAARQARMQRAQAGAAGLASLRLNRDISLQDTVISTYHPNRGISGLLGETSSKLAEILSNHIFIRQLRDGTLRGRATGKASYRQILASGSLCMVLAAIIIFVGV